MLSGTLSISLIAVVILAVAFDFINGFHDTANSIATSVSTRILSPRQAILMAATLNFAGALMSHKVAKTISGGLVSGNLEQYVILSALLAAIIWNLITWYFGIPSSSSHALIGALVGASIAFFAGTDEIIWKGVWDKVVKPLVVSPVVGFFLAYVIMKTINFVLQKASNHFVNQYLSKLQIISAAWMAFSHGKNDAQKSMGIITLALISAGFLPKGADVPWEIMLVCAIAMGLGTSIGGWRIIKTMGVNMIKLAPINGFAAETSAAIIIETASGFGMPVSTTHVISSSIMGVGAAKRFSAVRWALARNIVGAWVLTIPVTAAMGAAITLMIKFIA